jgi:uncharacterized caspase-like protein
VTNLDAALKLLTDALIEAAREAARDVARQELKRALAQGGDEWITQEEAARRAGPVTSQTIRAWLDAGYLGARGRRGRVNAQRLQAYLANRLVDQVEKEVPSATRELAASVLRKLGR